MTFLINFMNFLDFFFFPLIILLFASIVIEQIIRRIDSMSAYIFPAMMARKFIWQQNVLLNATWLILFLIFNIIAARQVGPTLEGDPNLLWKL